MGKYMFIANYTSEGAAGVLKEGGSVRREAIEALAKAAGGSVESFYLGFGSDDAFVTVELPDDETAAAIALTVSASGAVAVRTVVLLTPEQVDRAAKQSIEYRPPGS